MKKNLISILVISSILLLSGCSNDTTNSTTNNTTNNPKTNNSGTTVSEFVVVDTTLTSADDALKMLKSGNERFVTDTSILRNINQERRNQLKDGQNPYAVVVSCSDSRVTPTTIFNAGLGEIFDIRLAGNIVDDNALGSIEYAIEHCNSPLIVVMGHQNCGAVTATYNKVVKGEAAEGHIEDIVEKIEPNVNKDGTIDDAINNNVDAVVKEISEDDIVKKFINEGKVKIVGAYYDLDGKVNFK